MDANRFDSLTRALQVVSPRRAFSLGVAAFGAALLPSSPARAVPDCDKGGKRLGAINACWAKRGIPVRGECSCAWFGHGPSSDFPCNGNASCICLLTTEGTGLCAQPPLSDASCDSSADCQNGGCAVIDHDYVCQGGCPA